MHEFSFLRFLKSGSCEPKIVFGHPFCSTTSFSTCFFYRSVRLPTTTLSPQLCHSTSVITIARCGPHLNLRGLWIDLCPSSGFGHCAAAASNDRFRESTRSDRWTEDQLRIPRFSASLDYFTMTSYQSISDCYGNHAIRASGHFVLCLGVTKRA